MTGRNGRSAFSRVLMRQVMAVSQLANRELSSSQVDNYYIKSFLFSLSKELYKYIYLIGQSCHACCLVTAVIGCFTPIHRPSLGSSLHTLTLPAAWRQVSSISIYFAHSRVHAARELHVTASAQSKCLSVTGRPWLRVRSTHLSAGLSHSHIACGMAASFDN